MGKCAIPRVIIAGTHSGVGKTTIVTGLLAAYARQGLNVQSYKVGPDYIDPGYHRLATGKPSYNLDTWLVGEERLAETLCQSGADSDLVIIEGVMGLYDGGAGGLNSTAAIAKLLNTPVILVINAASMAQSAAALALGFRQYDPGIRLAGVILNRLGSDHHRRLITEALDTVGIPVLGAICRDQDLTVPERHLGLKPVTENDAGAAVRRMGDTVEQCVDLAAVHQVARNAPGLEIALNDYKTNRKPYDVTIAVAKDAAFSFYYPDSLAVLEQMGAKLVFFSPIHDRAVPAADGILLGGGFPEMFLTELEANQPMRQSLRRCFDQGMPIYGECGGYMYLTETVTDFHGKTYQMAGLIPAACRMEQRLQMVGYVEATAIASSILCAPGEKLRGHEFHFSAMFPKAGEENPAFSLQSARSGRTEQAGYARDNLLASYLHIHFAGQPQAAERFLGACEGFRVSRSY